MNETCWLNNMCFNIKSVEHVSEGNPKDVVEPVGFEPRFHGFLKQQKQ